MGRKSQSANGRIQRGRKPRPATGETEDDMPVPAEVRAESVARGVDPKDALRQMMARRRLEQYLETKRLHEHLQEIFYEEDR